MIQTDKQDNLQGKILIAGQFPPPVHGFSYITKKMAELIGEKHEATIIDLVPHDPKNPKFYNLYRLLLTLKGAIKIVFHAKAPLYIACEGGAGLLYTIILSLAARFKQRHVYLHHHSFNYLDQKRSLMNILVKALGKYVTHIFLCDVMRSKFENQYGAIGSWVVISNSAFVEPVIEPIKHYENGAPILVGLISNLNEEKGLSLFLHTIRLAQKDGVRIKGILAGPAASEKDRQVIEAAQKELGDALDYRGALYGDEKDKFFKELDIFLFPTQYHNEAQPTVIAEAMSYGIPVLSYNRGCIKNQVDECGAVFEKDDIFSQRSLQWIANNKSTLNELKVKTRQAYLDDRDKAIMAAQNLISTKEICKECDVNLTKDYMDLSKFKVDKDFRGRSPFIVQLWWLVQALLVHPTPQFMYGWRRFWWKAFGAEIGNNVLIRPSARVTYPWKVKIGDNSWIGDRAELYSLGPIIVGNNAVISQDAYLCAATHDHNKSDFPLIQKAIFVKDEAWVAAGAFIAPGVTIGKGAIIGARSVVLEDVAEAQIWAGNPAKVIKNREKAIS